MGLIKSLKKLKLKKLQPGRIVKSVVHAGAALGVPGAATADKAIDRIGKKVESVNKVVDRVKDAVRQDQRQSGGSTSDAIERVAGRALAGAEGALAISTPNGQLLIAAVVIVVLALILGKMK